MDLPKDLRLPYRVTEKDLCEDDKTLSGTPWLFATRVHMERGAVSELYTLVT
jgi:hypothetical protein